MYLNMKIHKSSLADWGMDEDEAYENALSNTYSLSPPEFISGNDCFLILLMRAKTLWT